MPALGRKSAMDSATDAEPTKPVRLRKKRFRWRPILRGIHRDIGYLAVGLTLVYALSGIAVNHIEDWDPNFVHVDTTHQLEGIPSEEADAVAFVESQLGIEEAADDVFSFSESRIVVNYAQRSLTINPVTGSVAEKGQSPRFILRIMNWLHLNRGKKAWTYFADGYAAMLVFLALSGMFMLPGRRGLIGRGGVLVLIGVALPLLYVHYSGGP